MDGVGCADLVGAGAVPAPTEAERLREPAIEQGGPPQRGGGSVFIPTFDDSSLEIEHPASSSDVVGVRSLIRDSTEFDAWRGGVFGEVRSEGLGGSFLGFGVWGLVTTPLGEGVRGEAYTDPPQGSGTGVAGFSNGPTGRAGYFEANGEAVGVQISHISGDDLALDVSGRSSSSVFTGT